MKKVIIILILGLNLILLNSCAKPTVVNVTLPKDNELNCEKLEDALADAQEFRKKAIEATGTTLDNQLRGLFFWPALMVTYSNAHEAIVAAGERSIQLINIMQKKNCKNLDKLLTGNDLHLLSLVENIHRLLAESLFKDTISGQATFKRVRNSSGLFVDLLVHVMSKLTQFDVAARLATFPHKSLYGIAESIANRAGTVPNIGNVTVLHHDVPAGH